METREINLERLAKTLCGILILESVLFYGTTLFTADRWLVLGSIRFMEILFLLYQRPLTEPIWQGVFSGIKWSIIFGICCLLAGIIFRYPFINLTPILQFELPGLDLSFLIVGVFLSPIAEEIFFRGILYQYMRRWGRPVAVVLSTLIFALVHFPGINLFHFVGGLLFVIVYEKEKNLMTPIIVHILGNLGVFLVFEI